VEANVEVTFIHIDKAADC